MATRATDCCFSPIDDASVVGAVFALSPCMAEKSLEERVSAIEAQLGHRTLEQHFREQAELIDRRFVESFREQGRVHRSAVRCTDR